MPPSGMWGWAWNVISTTRSPWRMKIAFRCCLVEVVAAGCEEDGACRCHLVEGCCTEYRASKVVRPRSQEVGGVPASVSSRNEGTRSSARAYSAGSTTRHRNPAIQLSRHRAQQCGRPPGLFGKEAGGDSFGKDCVPSPAKGPGRRRSSRSAPTWRGDVLNVQPSPKPA